MNKNILLVMKWLKNPETVTQEELKANRKSAWDAYAGGGGGTAWAAAAAGGYAAGGYDDANAAAVHWVDVYFEVTSEDKQTYIDALGE
jgi:hypothetical protein